MHFFMLHIYCIELCCIHVCIVVYVVHIKSWFFLHPNRQSTTTNLPKLWQLHKALGLRRQRDNLSTWARTTWKMWNSTLYLARKTDISSKRQFTNYVILFNGEFGPIWTTLPLRFVRRPIKEWPFRLTIALKMINKLTCYSM